jgi:hypothetical protein
MPEELSISRSARGKRPAFFPENPVADRLLSMTMALVSEVAVLRERQDTVERLLHKSGVVKLDAIESYEADLETEQARAQWRQAYIERVLETLQQEVDQLQHGDIAVDGHDGPAETANK